MNAWATVKAESAAATALTRNGFTWRVRRAGWLLVLWPLMHTGPVCADAAKPNVDITAATHPVRVVRFDRLLFAGGRGFVDPVLGYLLSLDRVDYHADGTALWHFTAWNKSTQEVPTYVYKAQTFITDENGNKYAVDQVNLGWKPDGADHFAEIKAAPGQKQSFYLTFPHPKPDARAFRLSISSSQRWPAVSLVIPPSTLPDKAPAEAPAEERFDEVESEIKPAPGQQWTMVREVGHPFALGIKVPYTISMEGMQWLKNGDVRIHLSCWNHSQESVRDEFVVQSGNAQSVLVTPQGKMFPLVGSSLGQVYERVMVNASPGEKKTFWLEFRGPVPVGKHYLLRWVNGMGLPDMPFRLP